MWVWIDGQVLVVLHLKQHETLYVMFMKNWAILGFVRFIVCFEYSNSDEGCNCKFNSLYLGV
jgi:hypothetical protein